MHISTTSLRNAGLNNSNWSSNTDKYESNPWYTWAYYLEFDASGTNPSRGYARFLGLPVRCLVYVVDGWYNVSNCGKKEKV